MEKIIENQKVLDNKKVLLQTIKEIYKSGFKYEYNKIILPHLTHDELLARYRNIKPIVYHNNLFYYLKRYNEKMMRTESLLSNLDKDIRREVNMYGSLIIDDFPVYHEYSNMNFFEPKVAEILEQFPDELLEESNAFYILDYPQNTLDLCNQLDVLKSGCHKSTVRALRIK